MEGKHGTRVRGKKDILTKVTKDSVRVSRAYYPVVSNIGSRTTSSPANTTVTANCLKSLNGTLFSHV